MWTWFVMPGCAACLIVMWLVFGRDKKTIPTITMEPPQGLDPLEMEYAQIANITDRGIYAEILYWVSKRLLEVFDEREHAGVRRIADLPDGASEHERFLFQRLFSRGDEVRLDRFPADVSDHKPELRDLVGQRFTGKNKVVENDDMRATMTGIFIMIIGAFVVEVTVDVGVFLSMALGILLFLALALLQDGALGFRSKYDRFQVIAGTIGMVGLATAHFILLKLHTGSFLFAGVFLLCFLICVPCVMFMERRVNHRLYGQILGFRTFIETAEWDRLRALSQENPDYGMGILPYAMLFNMGTKWTAGFENKTIYTAVQEMEEMEESMR